ncbi:MAG: hypothetical protein D6814_16125 [Calditrichaeota bacterium]|nr:MAG: hypothetical protein D6814_16125 [Calditrichota bacterium]
MAQCFITLIKGNSAGAVSAAGKRPANLSVQTSQFTRWGIILEQAGIFGVHNSHGVLHNLLQKIWFKIRTFTVHKFPLILKNLCNAKEL